MKKELSNKVSEILKDERIINNLKKYFKENNGFLMGKIEYFDDIPVLIIYGITLENKNDSQAKIFSYKLTPCTLREGHEFNLRGDLPEIPSGAREMTYPTAKTINQNIKDFLKNPKNRLINYSPFLKKI